MNIKQCILIGNDCYKKGVGMGGGKPKGILVHSTGANNPNIKRYVQPIKGQAGELDILNDIGTNKNANSWNRKGLAKCVHAFIGKNSEGEVEIYQTLPFNMCCWGCGSGSKGSYNATHVQFEICEDNLKDYSYFISAMQKAQSLCAYLCRTYGIKIADIVSHKEAHDKGYASNHGDPDYWLAKHGKDMTWFRTEVEKRLCGEATPTVAVTADTVVTIRPGATYYSGKSIPQWVMEKEWIVKAVKGNRAVIDKSADGKVSICSPINVAFLTPSGKEYQPLQTYTVKLTTDALRIRSGPGTNYKTVTTLRDMGIYQITEEATGQGAVTWGKLADGRGWISLDWTKRV